MIKNFSEFISEKKKWSGDVETEWNPKEGTFTKKEDETQAEMSDRIAKYLKRESDGLKQAMSRLNYYINRGGKNISKTDKKALEVSKSKLRDLYGKKEKED